MPHFLLADLFVKLLATLVLDSIWVTLPRFISSVTLHSTIGPRQRQVRLDEYGDEIEEESEEEGSGEENTEEGSDEEEQEEEEGEAQDLHKEPPTATHEDHHDRAALEARLAQIEENQATLSQEIKDTQAELKQKLEEIETAASAAAASKAGADDATEGASVVGVVVIAAMVEAAMVEAVVDLSVIAAAVGGDTPIYGAPSHRTQNMCR
ncbi:uncharacterized protein LOC131254262 [Magnolia sinica]|uniref:uncharacterized protein LOC131254262 n=1 Tax=Magnolia sinica TaxID=86752 RepID=UPI00265B1F92|nr:uncharacterized protein LOC131254262 [Magnolia sinica]